MRGKHILWLSLVAMLLTVTMVNIGTAPVPSATKLIVEPSRLPKAPNLGHPGDEYEVTIKIENVEDLYAAGFTVQFAPWGRTFSASNAMEGDFLSEGGLYSTAFKATISVFAGEIKVGITRLGAVPGRTGREGILMTCKMTVVEGGDSDIEIIDSVLLDSNLNPINHNTVGAKYYGATADLVKIEMPTGKHIYVGENADFLVTARNDGDVPLYVKARVEMERQEDGRDIRLYSGQTYYGGYLGASPPYTYLYCDGYYYDEWAQWLLEDYWGATAFWNQWGSSPYLDAIEDGNLINSTTAWTVSGLYTFEDISLPFYFEGTPYSVISNVDLFGYTIGGDDDHDIDPFVVSYDEEGNWNYIAWCDSMGKSTTWKWTGLKWAGSGYPEAYGTYILTEQGINNAEVFVEYFIAIPEDGQLMGIDCLRWLVEFATIVPVEPDVYCIPPGEQLVLDPITWVPVADHVGKYDASVTLEYSETYPEVAYHFKNTGKKVHTFHFWVEE